MRKQIIIDDNARKELKRFNKSIQRKFVGLFTILGEEGKLDFPDARKISYDLFEIRVKVGGIYRGLYAYVQRGYIVILHIFQKKSQKTPLKDIKTAEGRLIKYKP